MSEEGITEAVSGLRELAQRFRVRLILQFGSTVTGTTHDRSDLDLAIRLHRADPLFLKKIVESCRVLFGIPQDLACLRLHAFKAYQDFRPYLELERRHVARRLSALMAKPSRP